MKKPDGYSNIPPIRYIQQLLYDKNQNFQAVVIGDVGTGKSSSSIRIAEKINKDFDPEEDIVFNTIEFLEGLVNNKWDRGDAIVWDEVGESMNKRESMTVLNRTVNSIARTYRRRNYAVIMNLPDFHTLDKEIKKNIDCLIKTMHMNRAKKYVKTKWKFLQFNSEYQKIYFKRPQIKLGEDRVPKIIDGIKIKKPSETTWKKYEEMRDKFQEELDQKNLQRAKQKLGIDQKKKDKEPTKKDKIKSEMKEIMEEADYNNPKEIPTNELKQLAGKYDTTKTYVRQIRSEITLKQLNQKEKEKETANT